MTTKPQVTTTAWHRATQHCALEGTSHSTWHFEQSPVKALLTVYSLELPYPLERHFWVDDFSFFPLRWDICFLLPSSSQPGANDHTSPTWKTLKKGPTSIPSWCRPTFPPDVGLPKIIPYKALPWLNHNEPLGEFSRLKIPLKISHLQLESYWYLILRKNTQGHTGEVKFLVFGDFLGKINTKHLLF